MITVVLYFLHRINDVFVRFSLTLLMIEDDFNHLFFSKILNFIQNATPG